MVKFKDTRKPETECFFPNYKLVLVKYCQRTFFSYYANGTVFRPERRWKRLRFRCTATGGYLLAHPPLSGEADSGIWNKQSVAIKRTQRIPQL